MIPAPLLAILKSEAFLKAIAVAAILAAAFMAGWAKGSLNEVRKAADREVQRALATVKLREARERVVYKIQVRVKKEIDVVREQGETIVKEVPVYVTKEDDSRCELATGFLRHYDAGLRNEPPGPATDLDRSPSGVALSDAAQAIAKNNAAFAECRSKLRGWERFYRDLRKAKVDP